VAVRNLPVVLMYLLGSSDMVLIGMSIYTKDAPIIGQQSVSADYRPFC